MASVRKYPLIYYRGKCKPERCVLLSVKPIYCNLIIARKKYFEYRKSIFRDFPKRIYVYSSYPQRRIVASFEPSYIIESTPDNIWADSFFGGGIAADAFVDYFRGKDSAFAIRISCVREFKRPVSLNELDPRVKAPQNFCYLDEQQVLQIEEFSKPF